MKNLRVYICVIRLIRVNSWWSLLW